MGRHGGDVAAAVLPEPVATAAESEGCASAHPVHRLLDLQQEWASATGSCARYPQAGAVVHSEWLRDRLEIGPLLLDAITAALRRLEWHAQPAADARPDFEFFFTQLLALAPDLVGGGLTDNAFYYVPQVARTRQEDST